MNTKNEKYVTREEFEEILNILDNNVGLLNDLQSRVFGIDVALRGVALMLVLDGVTNKDKVQKRGDVLKELLNTLTTNLLSQSFMQDINKDSFKSSSNGIITTIDEIVKNLQNNSNK